MRRMRDFDFGIAATALTSVPPKEAGATRTLKEVGRKFTRKCGSSFEEMNCR
jgi:hypothetical protein